MPTFLTSSGIVQAASPTGWETLYASYRWDGDPSIMYYVRNRLLLPCIGAWNRRDPVGYVDGMNLFAIASPVKLTDPQGTFPQEAVANRPCNGPPAVYLQTHHVKSGNHHLSILIVPNDGGQHLRQHFPNVPLVPLPHYPSQLRDRTGLTLGAGPSALFYPEVEADFNRTYDIASHGMSQGDCVLSRYPNSTFAR